jgi:hypothetical protein
LSIFPGSPAHRGLAAYLVSEAIRIETLAAGAGADGGRESFTDAAREYRALAEAIDNIDQTEEPMELRAAPIH